RAGGGTARWRRPPAEAGLLPRGRWVGCGTAPARWVPVASPARRATSATSRRARVPGVEAEPNVGQRVVHGRAVCLHLVAVAVVAGDLDGAHAAAAAAHDALLREGL